MRTIERLFIQLEGTPNLVVFKRDSLVQDQNLDGIPSAGDTILYTITITNSGSAPAEDVVLQDTLDPNVTLDSNSLDADQGQIIRGDGATDTEIEIALGTMLPQTSAQVSFKVQINSPIPLGVTAVQNHARISAANTGTIVSDDPDTATPNDSTITSFVAEPKISATKRDQLLIDLNQDGIANPGDVIEYSVLIVNSGSRAATQLVFSDTLDLNVTLIQTATTTSKGTLIVGNQSSDQSLRLEIDQVNGGGDHVRIVYRVRINSPLPAGVAFIENQGTVSFRGYPSIQTDDPDTDSVGDPTRTSLISSPKLEATKRDLLLVDADGDNVPSPGDTISYRIKIANVGNQASTDVIFRDQPDANSQLKIGSVKTTQGTVRRGNGEGDTAIEVDVGHIAGGDASVMIMFEVVIDSPVPANVVQISNQGSVESNELPQEPTDDPDTQETRDATVTSIAAVPVIRASKRDFHLVDADGDMVPSPGDTIVYRILVENRGNQAATKVQFSDSIISSATLIPGTVKTDKGTILRGNGNHHSTVEVDIGTLPGGDRATITFSVQVNPLLPGVNQLSNQGSVSGENFTAVLTDDPDSPANEDATITPLTAAPVLSASKRGNLYIDADENGVPSPGDTILYEITIVNSGNSPATQVVFADTLDHHTTLVTGTVSSSLGVILSGNKPGDTDVSVDVGILLGAGTSVDVGYQAKIRNPIPANVDHIQNQGIVTSSELPAVSTDDPDTDAVGDATVTSLIAAPIMTASQTATLLVDGDEDGKPSPGDTLLLDIKIRNAGNIPATGVLFRIELDTNITIVSSSVQISQGTLIKNDRTTENEIQVNLGTVSVGSSGATISFQVKINNPLPANVATLEFQGFVTGDEFEEIVTDDPNADGRDNPTLISVIAAPLLRVTMSDVHYIDADRDGRPSPGDTLLYRITIKNSGNGAATGIIMENQPDPHTALIPGQVQSTQGVVLEGNQTGDEKVVVNIGVLAGDGGSVTISLQVLVKAQIFVNQIENQAVVNIDNPNDSGLQIRIESDDPDTKERSDSTTTPVLATEVMNHQSYLSLILR